MVRPGDWMERTTILHGKRILIVEAEFLIALDIQRILEAAEAGQSVFARSAEEANALRARWHEFELAIIDISQHDEAALRLAEAVREAGIALVISSSDVRYRRGAPTLPGAPVVLKPFTEADLVAACRAALTRQRRG